jgi:hypothetical protein
MPKLKLPRVTRTAEPLPPELRRLADEPPSFTVLLGRREFLKAAGVLAAALAVPFTGVRRAYARARGGFFTRPERATLEALVDRVIPPDRDPGARALGVAVYIERLLTAFDGAGTPPIFAGGPFSNRNPFPDERRGRRSRRRPPNAFKQFIPLTRLQTLRWRAEIFGSAAVAGAGFNDAALGPWLGLRQIYRDGLAKVDQVAVAMKGRPFARLARGDRDAVLGALDRGLFPADRRRGTTFLDVVIQHTLEGSFAAPEYGGNHRGRGWRLVRIEGDNQPLGYSIFSTDKNDYNERPTNPMSTPNPDELRHGQLRPHPISADGLSIEDAILTLTGPFENT